MRRSTIASLLVVALLAVGFSAGDCSGQESAELESETPYGAPPDMSVLSPSKWRQIDSSVDRALDWLAPRQAEDGSIPTFVGGQPAVTALVTMAFLARGHQPGEGPHGETVRKGIDYVLSCQRPDGMFLLDSTDMPVINWERGAHTGLYNHAISSLMLCEAYGSTDTELEPRVRQAIKSALTFSRKMQLRKQPFLEDRGGFRYFKSLNGFAGKGDSDLSVTGWFVMFFRSAKHAGFDVPEEHVDDAIEYVEKCYDPRQQAFYYGLHGHDRQSVGRAMTGAGLVCLAAKGDANRKIAIAAGKWILEHPFDEYGATIGWYDRYHYGAYYCSQAMLQLGGEYWAKFYPTLAENLLENQTKQGFWPPEQAHNDAKFGSEYSTALAVLTLTSPFRLLPITQR